MPIDFGQGIQRPNPLVLIGEFRRWPVVPEPKCGSSMTSDDRRRSKAIYNSEANISNTGPPLVCFTVRRLCVHLGVLALPYPFGIQSLITQRAIAFLQQQNTTPSIRHVDMADSTPKSYSTDPALYLYTSLTSGSSHIVTATSRLETILKANKIPFKAIDIATDEKARMLWGRRSGKDESGRPRKIPGLVQMGLVIGVRFARSNSLLLG